MIWRERKREDEEKGGVRKGREGKGKDGKRK